MAEKVAVLSAGGLAPCLSSALGYLLEIYTAKDPTIEIICYKSGYKGLLLGDYNTITPEMRAAVSRDSHSLAGHRMTASVAGDLRGPESVCLLLLKLQLNCGV